MRVLESVQGAFTKLANFAALSGGEFRCSDCERVERCGNPPSERCIVRAAQIARDGGKPVRRITLIEW